MWEKCDASERHSVKRFSLEREMASVILFGTWSHRIFLWYFSHFGTCRCPGAVWDWAGLVRGVHWVLNWVSYGGNWGRNGTKYCGLCVASAGLSRKCVKNARMGNGGHFGWRANGLAVCRRESKKWAPGGVSLLFYRILAVAATPGRPQFEAYAFRLIHVIVLSHNALLPHAPKPQMTHFRLGAGKIVKKILSVLLSFVPGWEAGIQWMKLLRFLNNSN